MRFWSYSLILGYVLYSSFSHTKLNKEQDTIQTRSCGLRDDEKKKTHTYAHQGTPFLTHEQGCVTGSKIRPVAPGCLRLIHGGP